MAENLLVGLIGPPTSGKTTIFNLLTGQRQETRNYSLGKSEVHQGSSLVLDERLDFLAEVFKPKKKIYAAIDFLDVAGLSKEGQLPDEMRDSYIMPLKNADALIYVIRGFDLPGQDPADPAGDLEALFIEMGLSDLKIIETRLEKLKKSLKRIKNPDDEKQIGVLQQCREELLKGNKISDLDLKEKDEILIRGFSFLTAKPLLALLNIGDEKANLPIRTEWTEALKKIIGFDPITIFGATELELQDMSSEEAAPFLEDLGLTESGLERFVRETYRRLGLITFFTGAEKEVHAWTLKRGMRAIDAARTIHTDLARGFIRADVLGYDDFRQAGSLAAGREAGKFHVEGADYEVRDGDYILVRFNI